MQEYKLFRLLCIFLFLFCINACSFLEPLGIEEKESGIAGEKSPILLSLSQGYVAETTLHLRVQLEFLDDVVTDSVYVQLKGLSNGVVQEEQTLPLRNFVDQEVSSTGTKIFLPFTLAIRDLDRFTIACSWGEAGYKLAAFLDVADAHNIPSAPSIKEADPLVRISELKVGEVELPCQSGLCSVRVNLEGRILRGDVNKEVRAVALAYKLIWVPDGSLPPLGANSKDLEPDEKLLPFGEEILPVEGFEFKVLGDKDLPKIPGGRFMPVVRILRYNLLE